MTRWFFTSESVTEGHPDKMADQISDGILDAILELDPDARVACETLLSTGLVVITGEISTSAYVDFQEIVRQTVKDIGYTRAKYGFDGDTCAVLSSISEQSPDIAMGVDLEYEKDMGDQIGAGDQGIMFGYACDETDTLMPLSIYLAHGLTKRLAQVRKDGTLSYLRPDGKSQVTVEYQDDKPVRIENIVLSTQHAPDIDRQSLEKDIIDYVILPVIGEDMIDEKTEYYINPTGRFVIGGPQGDAGLTGRKIIVDTYGGYARHGGGAFSGKDPTKVDRSAAYAARYVAKNIVAAGLASKCEIGVSYAIGIAHPLSIYVDTFGTGKILDEDLTRLIGEVFDLRPAAIIKDLDLKKPIYKDLAAYGHMGREDLGVSWEKTDKVEELQERVKFL